MLFVVFFKNFKNYQHCFETLSNKSQDKYEHQILKST